MLFHEATARALSEHRITTVFGVLGDANLYIMEAFQRLNGGIFVSMSNEAGAVLAANGYARTSGDLGVATVTHGPALTNTVTALVESVRDRTPLLLIAGDTAALDRDNLQNISQRDIVIPTGAGFEQVRDRTRWPRTLPRRSAARSSSAAPWCSTSPSNTSGTRCPTRRHPGSGLPRRPRCRTRR